MFAVLAPAAVFELQFLSPDQIEMKTLEGQTTRYRRAQTYAFTELDLQAFAGRYQNGEIGTIFEIVPSFAVDLRTTNP